MTTEEPSYLAFARANVRDGLSSPPLLVRELLTRLEQAQAAAHGFNAARMDAEAKLADASAQVLRQAAVDLDEAAMHFPIDAGEDDGVGAALEMGGSCVKWLNDRAARLAGSKAAR